MKKCNKHPRYKGIRPPKCGCKDCLKVYMTARGLDEVLDVASSMSNVLFNIAQDLSQFNNPRGYPALAKLWQSKWDEARRKFDW